MCGSVRYRDAETAPLSLPLAAPLPPNCISQPLQNLHAETAPLSLPLAAPLPPNCIAQPLQNLHVETTSNTLPRRYELTVHQTVDANEFRELFD
jgi:hypothetical protein